MNTIKKIVIIVLVGLCVMGETDLSAMRRRGGFNQAPREKVGRQAEKKQDKCGICLDDLTKFKISHAKKLPQNCF